MGMISLLYTQVQRKAVMLMVSHMYSEIGIIDLDEGNLESAAKNFRTHVDMSRELASLSGEHILVSPMSLLANALSMMGKFDESLPLFDSALVIAERHVGSEHESLASLLVNSGIALVQTSSFEKALERLERAIYIMKINEVSPESILYQRAHQFRGKALRRESEL